MGRRRNIAPRCDAAPRIGARRFSDAPNERLAGFLRHYRPTSLVPIVVADCNRASDAPSPSCYCLAMHRLKACVLAAILSAAVGFSALEARQAAPRFRVDPSWPLELPNNWILGSVTGVYVDSRQ